MGFLSVLSMAHKWISERVMPGELVIDATAGGGVDTLALALLVGRKGKVLAFDIQQEALDKTNQRLQKHENPQALAHVELVQDSHENMEKYVTPAIKPAAVMFNLGYFPGGDESIITQPTSTIAALEAAFRLLRRGGLITCTLYPGHAGGDTEAATVEQWAASLSVKDAHSVIYRQLQRTEAPYLIAIEKR